MNSMYRHASRAYVVPRAACAPPLCSNYGSVRLRLFTGVHRTSGGEPSAELLQGAHHCSGTGADRTGPWGGTTLFLPLVGRNHADRSARVGLNASRFCFVLLFCFFFTHGFFGRVKRIKLLPWRHWHTWRYHDYLLFIIADKSVTMAAADGFSSPAATRPVGYKETLSLTRDEWCPLLCRTRRLADRRVSWDP